MSDRYQIEMAAKAAGLRGRWEEQPGRFVMVYDTGDDCGVWNPLADDGDALRLATALSLFLQINGHSATAWKWRGDPWYEQASDYADDINAATRRAIVRAAAEIGKSLP